MNSRHASALHAKFTRHRIKVLIVKCAIVVKWINRVSATRRVVFTAQNVATFFFSGENFRSLFLSYDIGSSGPFYIKAVRLITGSGGRRAQWEKGKIKPPRIYCSLKSRMTERYRFARYLRLSTIFRASARGVTASGEQEILLGRCRFGILCPRIPGARHLRPYICPT